MPGTPAVVLFQLLIFLVGCGLSRNVNFHNVMPPMSPTPFPKSFKCFTCNNALDNYECNRWAEDKWCPQNTEYCLTVHKFTSRGRSESVSKRCVSKEECHSVGCHHIRKFGYTECVSCCEGTICNIEVPTNHTNAVFMVKQQQRSPSSASIRIQNLIWITTALPVLLLVWCYTGQIWSNTSNTSGTLSDANDRRKASGICTQMLMGCNVILCSKYTTKTGWYWSNGRNCCDYGHPT